MTMLRAVALTAAILALECGQPRSAVTNQPDSSSAKKKKTIEAEEAVRIATREAAKRQFDVSKVTATTQLRAGIWIVTFPESQTTRGLKPDFLTQVWVNATTGVVEQFRVGS